MNEETLFHLAREKPPDERAAFLDEACAGDTALRQRVEILLAAHEHPGSFLKPATRDNGNGEPASNAGRTVYQSGVQEGPGTVIGHYKLLQQIGEGGMGVVFMAEQSRPVRRTVALKIIKPGMDSRQVIARFEAERQALAMMDHPNIARVLDAGTTDSGRPYFVMELVKGVPITTYCDEHRLTPQDRLELFVYVCHAVQHAHQKGIIHRDLKPSNVLIAQYDGKPVPKVIDFGVAKATGQQLTERTMFTSFGNVIGTPEYMSPEQAELNQLDIDTRSDVYSLGVLLYELLTGTTPIEHKRVKEAALLEVLRVIREEEPPKPSTRLSTVAELPSIAAQRGLEPKKLSGLVKGELDWIVMKALEKDRARRYETASGFAGDIERFLHDEPVQACPPSAVYRFRKFARRNKTALLASSAALLILLALVVGLAASNRIIAGERDRKEAAWRGEQRALALAQQRGDEAARNLVVARESECTARHALYAAQINLAQQSAAAADMDHMLELLNGLRPDPDQEDLRGFEWYYLWRLCHSELLTLQEFSSPVRSAVFSPDGKTLATSHGSEVKLWNPTNGELVATLKESSGQVRSIAFSPDGTLLAVGNGADGGTGDVRLWDVATKKRKLILPTFEEPVSAVAFSPDGQTLATATAAFIASRSATADRALAIKRGVKADRVRFWAVESGKTIGNCDGTTDSVLSIAFSPDGAFLAAGIADGQVIVWKSSSLRKETSLPHSGVYISAVTFSPDGNTLAAGAGGWSGPGQAILWKFPSMQPIRVLSGHRGGVTSLAFSPDGQTIATGGYDRTICLWRTASAPVQTFHGHRGFVSSVAFAPDGRTVVSSSWDNSVRLWDIGKNFGGTGATKAFGTGAAFLPDGRLVLNDDMKVIDRAAGTTRAVEAMPSDGAVAVSSDGRMIAIGDGTGNVVVWDSSTLKRQHEFHDDDKRIWSVSFSPNGSTLASAGDGDKVVLRDLASDRIIRILQPQGHRVRSIAFSPDGAKLATATCQAGSTVQIWDLRSGEAQQLKGGGATSVAFSRDGRVIALGRQKNVLLYDAHSCKLLHSISGHSDDVWQVAFSPDGKTLASTSWDETLRLWSVNSGELLLTFQLNDAVFATAFSGDGRTLAATAAHNNTRFWDAADPIRADQDIDAVLHRSGALKRLGKLPESEQFLRAALGVHRQRFGNEHACTARVMVELASLLIARANAAAYPEAESLLITSHSVLVQKLAPGHQWRVLALNVARDLYGPAAMNDRRKLADVAAALGNRSSQPSAGTALSTTEADSKDAHAHLNLGNALRDLRKLDEAIDQYREAIRLEPDIADARDQLAAAINKRAWSLANGSDQGERDPARALKLAKEAVEIAPKNADYWNTLGVASYRASDLNGAVVALQKYREVRTSKIEWGNLFYLAMAHWQLGNKDEARGWYDKAAAWMDKNAPTNSSLIRLRSEAAELLGVSSSRTTAPDSPPASNDAPNVKRSAQ